ncbi:MAG: ABC transporter substrate-binding protein [Acetobacteraceae bacterium]|nr:ABC transporter substrate-binding protein [Acetobacteraceae bacterium]
MHRRSFAAIAAAAVPALAAPAVAQTQNPEVRWRLQSSFGRNLDILFSGAEHLSKRVAELTDNRFQIRAFPAGEIAPGLQVLDAVQSGNELCAEMLREFNCVGFLLGETGTQMGGWFRNEIRSLSDLNGLKFRIAGMGGQIFQRLCASPALIAGADVYPSLERGTIDAAEWVGPHDDERLGFQRVAKFYYAPAFWEPCARGHLIVNQRAWDPLPDAYKAAVQVACAETELEMVARYDVANPVALRRLVGGGAQLRAWPREVLQAAWRAGHELMEENASKSARFKRVWDSYRPFRDDQFQWFRVAENSYDNFAFTAAAR